MSAAQLTAARAARWRRGALWAVPFAFLALFFFFPLLTIFGTAGESLLQNGVGAAGWARLTRALGFTFWQAGLSTLLTLAVGLPAAAVFGRYTFPGKRLVGILSTLPFILPTVVVAAAFNALVGPRGWLNVGLMDLMGLKEPPIQLLNSLAAIVLVHVFYNATIVIRVVGSAWAQLDPRLEQAARVLGASPLRAWREVTFPLLRPALWAAVVLVFLFDFTSFGVVLLLGGPRYATLEVEIYIQAMQMLNIPLAGLLSLIQMGCTLAITALYTRLSRQQGDIPLTPRVHGEGLRPPRSRAARWFVFGVAAALLLLLAAPLGALGARSVTRLAGDREGRTSLESGLTLDYYRELFVNRREVYFYVPPAAALRNSLVYAAETVAISLTLGFLAAYAVNRKGGWGRVLNLALMLPLGTSAVTLGLGYLVAFNRPPLEIARLPFLIPAAHSLVALPFVVRTLQPALASIPVRLRQAAATLGASPWQVWKWVDLPIVGRAALVGAIFSFTISLGEFGATSFLARPEYPTLPVAIYRFLSQPGAYNYGQAMAMSTILMLVCALSIFLMEKLEA